jgi:hypothetical protein
MFPVIFFACLDLEQKSSFMESTIQKYLQETIAFIGNGFLQIFLNVHFRKSFLTKAHRQNERQSAYNQNQ